MSRATFGILALFIFQLALTMSVQDFRNNLVRNLTKTYCPLYGFFRPICPNSNFTKSNNNTPQIIGGLGYNQVTRELRWPIFVARNSKIQTQKSSETKRFSNLEEYLKFMGCDDKSQCRGGLYVGTDEYIQTLIDTFADYHQNMVIRQTHFRFFEAQSTTDYTPEFRSFLSALPPDYNPANKTVVKMYTALFDEFGTHVATKMKFGGIIFMMADLKVCLNDQNARDIDHELDYFLEHNFDPKIWCRSSPTVKYCKYRLIKTYENAGGAPDIDLRTNPQKLINSMEANPAVTDFEVLPLWKVVPTNYTNGVHQAYSDYISAYQKTRKDWVNHVETLKRQRLLGPQELVIYHAHTGQKDIGKTCQLLIDGNAYSPQLGSYPRFALQRWNLKLSAGNQVLLCSYRDYNRPEKKINWFIGRNRDGKIYFYNNAEPYYAAESEFLEKFVDETFENYSNDNSAMNDCHTLFSGYSMYGTLPITPPLSPSSPQQYIDGGSCVWATECHLRFDSNVKTKFIACMDTLSYIKASPADSGKLHYDVATDCAGF